MDEPNKLIEDRFMNLSLANQRAISNSDWKNKILEIGKNCNLTEIQSRALETEVLLLLYHFQPIENFFENVLKEVGTSEVATEKIINTIEEKILIPIDKEMEVKELSEGQTGGPPEWEKPKLASIPNYSDYEKGSDPYREPLE